MSISRLLDGSIVLLTTLLLPGAAYAQVDVNTLCTKFIQNSNCRNLQPNPETKETNTASVPISVTTANIEMIGVARILSAIQPGAVIGEKFCFSSLVRAKCGNFIVSGISDKAESGYQKIIAEELSRTGYSVSGASETAFEGVSGEATARFLIGATITKAQVQSIESENTFSSSSSWNTKAKITIRWEVLDQQTKNVIYNKETIGESNVPSKDVAPAAYEAARKSLKVVLADRNFVATLRSAGSASGNIPTTPLPTQAEGKPATGSNSNIPISPLLTPSSTRSDWEPADASDSNTPATVPETPLPASSQEEPANEQLW